MKIFVSIFLISLSLCCKAVSLSQEEALYLAEVLGKQFSFPLLPAVLMQESTACKNKIGEGTHHGCMQIGVAAATDVLKKYGNKKTKYNKKELASLLKNNDTFNIVIGGLYLRMKKEEFKGDINRALIAYNKGSKEARRCKFPAIHPYVLAVKRYTIGEIVL